MAGWEASTLAIDTAELTLLQGLDSPERRRCSLVVYSGGETGRQIRLAEGVSTLGRSAAADVQIDGAGMSRLHAELRVVGAQVTLRDLGSANGSFVRDQRINGSQPLRDGDLLRLGRMVLKFYTHGSLDAALHDRVYRLAMIDAGTGLYNRRYLHDALARELRRSRQGGRPISVIACDLDRFKSVNDSHGHAAGDLVLRESATLMARVLGDRGVLGRLGGDEFLALLPGLGVDAARDIGERMRLAVAGHCFVLPSDQPAVQRRLPYQQTLSIGVAEWQSQMLDSSDLLDTADRLLYDAKRAGRNRIHI